MIKIRIKNADHEIDVQFPISENKLYAKLAEIHAIEGKPLLCLLLKTTKKTGNSNNSSN